jgi:outer membrane protein OmpA-like peptidoglycan-associated protein
LLPSQQEEKNMRVVPKEVTVFRFPQHSAEINALPPEEKAKMDALATEIADSFTRGKVPIVAFFIIGHADRDQRGRDFEMQVSVKRAEAAQAWLVAQAKARVQQRGGNPAEVDMADFSLNAQGASNLYTQATTLPEREMNRRVVVKYATLEPDPLTDALGFAPNLARARLLITTQPQTDATRRVICALDKLANPATDDTYFEWGSLRQVAGGLGGLTDEQVLALARSIIMSLRRHIANNNNYGVPNIFGVPYAPDDIVVQNLLNWEQNVRHTKNMLVAAHGQAPVGKIHQSVGRYIARNEDNPNSILSCFKGT